MWPNWLTNSSVWGHLILTHCPNWAIVPMPMPKRPFQWLSHHVDCFLFDWWFPNYYIIYEENRWEWNWRWEKNSIQSSWLITLCWIICLPNQSPHNSTSNTNTKLPTHAKRNLIFIRRELFERQSKFWLKETHNNICFFYCFCFCFSFVIPSSLPSTHTQKLQRLLEMV